MRAFLQITLGVLLVFATSCQKPDMEIYTSLDSNEAKFFIDEYYKQTGNRINFVRLSTGEALARIRGEAKNPQAAAWFGGPSAEHSVAEEEGLLESYTPNTDYTIPAEHKGTKEGWHGLYMSSVAFGVNTEFLKKHNLTKPSSYQDLLKPEWKDQIGLAYPYTSGTAYTILASLVNLMQEDGAFAYIKELDKQVRQYTRSGSACVNQVSLGEIAVCIAFYQDIYNKGTGKGYPVEIIFPTEGSGYEIGAISLIKNNNDMNRAKAFVDWLYKKDVQALWNEWQKIPLHPEVPATGLGQKAKESKLIPMNANETSKEHERLLKRWREVTGK